MKLLLLLLGKEFASLMEILRCVLYLINRLKSNILNSIDRVCKRNSISYFISCVLCISQSTHNEYDTRFEICCSC